MYVPIHIEGNQEVDKSTKSAEILTTFHFPNPKNIKNILKQIHSTKLEKFIEL